MATSELQKERLVGHGWAAQLLQSAIDANSVSHAYLVRGPAGVGKHRLARDFALALACEQPPALGDGLRYCGVCRACRMIEGDKHPDVTTIGLEWQARQEGGLREGNVGQNLKIDTIRAVAPEISRPPKEIPWRIFIVCDAETMQTAAANAFLKTLEEPPRQAVLILLADSDRPMLPTITSRCQVLELRPVPSAEIEAALVERGANEGKAHTLAALAAGRPGYALEALNDVQQNFLGDRDEYVTRLEELLPADRVKRMAFAEELNGRWMAGPDKRVMVLNLINTWLGWWRDLLLVKNELRQYVTNTDKLAQLEKMAAKLKPEQIQAMLQGLTRAQAELDSNVSPRLAMGDLLLNSLPRI